MAGDGKPGNAAIWIALIGALVTSGGYLVAYYRDLSIQERNQEHDLKLREQSQKHDLVVRLLTEDARESSRNLLWAHDAGLIALSEATVTQLRDKPYEGPTRTAGEGSTETGLAEALPAEDMVSLVRALDAPSKSARSRALQALLDTVNAAPERAGEAVTAVLSSLSGDRLEALSAQGRYNLLYVLDRLDWSEVTPEARAGVKAALETVLARGEEGVAAIGPQTRALIGRVLEALGRA